MPNTDSEKTGTTPPRVLLLLQNFVISAICYQNEMMQKKKKSKGRVLMTGNIDRDIETGSLSY